MEFRVIWEIDIDADRAINRTMGRCSDHHLFLFRREEIP
jgi:hypothetical protein